MSSSSLASPPLSKAQDFRAMGRNLDQEDDKNATKTSVTTTLTKKATDPFSMEEFQTWGFGSEGVFERAEASIKAKTGLENIPARITNLLRNLSKLSGEALNKGLTTLLILLNSDQEIINGYKRIQQEAMAKAVEIVE